MGVKVDVMFRRERANEKSRTSSVRFRRSLTSRCASLCRMSFDLIFTALGVTTRSGMPGNTIKNEVSSSGNGSRQ